jgi:hypothetical protein
MDDNEYDEASRYLARRAGAGIMHWLLRLDATHVRFDSWLDSVLTLPGMKERICDAVARMANLDKGGVPFAAIVEFQTEPDSNMFGRLLLAGGICWLTVKPTDLPGDRFELCAVVVNLTGEGHCARDMTVGTAEWKLTPIELNLSTQDATVVLEEIASGQAPREVLAWISVMKKGGDDATMHRWLEIAGPETDLDRRGDYALVAQFAAAVGRQEAWRKTLEAFKMNESPVAREWRAEARREGKLEGNAEFLILALDERFAPLPGELVSHIRSSTDSGQLDRWMRLAVSATVTTLDQFRQKAGI